MSCGERREREEKKKKKWLENYRTVGKVKKIQFKSRREREGGYKKETREICCFNKGSLVS